MVFPDICVVIIFQSNILPGNVGNPYGLLIFSEGKEMQNWEQVSQYLRIIDKKRILLTASRKNNLFSIHFRENGKKIYNVSSTTFMKHFKVIHV